LIGRSQAIDLQRERLAWHRTCMPKPIKHEKRPRDVNQLAHYLVNESTEAISIPTTAQISVLMAELGRKGGKIGGKRRLETMTQKQRKNIAKKAALTRWGKRRGAKPKAKA
jgi:hypothetical protein